MIMVNSVVPGQNFVRFVRLSNGKEGEFDIAPYIEKGIFTELKNKSYFRQARVVFGGIV